MQRRLFAGIRVCRLFDGATPGDPFDEFGMLPREFPFQRVTLLASHRRDVQRASAGTA